MKFRVLFSTLLIAHCLLLVPFAGFLAQRPREVKLGYIPHPQILKVLVADYGLAVAEASVAKVLFYFGTLTDKSQNNLVIRPEYLNMYRILETASELDPYNMDIYYFAQAVFTWDLGKVKEVNSLLEYGMKNRTWDFWIPFYLGFNYAYFLKNYPEAAKYMQIAAKRSGNPLFTKLSARYFYESKQTDLGIVFLDAMITQSKDEAIKRTYQIRRDALHAITLIERALDEYKVRYGRLPTELQELLVAGFLEKLPVDPYGGTFYIENGRVRSTSKLANMSLEKTVH